MLKTTTRRLALAFLAVSPGCSKQVDEEPPRARHIVLISIDTLRADRLGFHGYPRRTSPHLDALAARSLVYTDCTAAATNTTPSHMSMFTGLCPGAHGVFNVGADSPMIEQGYLAPELLPHAVPLLAERLSAAGFETTAFTDAGFLTSEMQFDRGFDTFVAIPETIDRKVDRVLEWLKTADPAKRQFLFLHTYEVHGPYVPPEEHDVFTGDAYQGPLRDKLTEMRGRKLGGWKRMAEFFPKSKSTNAEGRFFSGLYDGGIRFTDAEIARLLDTLATEPWASDTAILVTSDHGEEFGEHGRFSHESLYQTVLHVPFLLHLPGGPTGEVDTPISGLDVTPTVLDVLGLPPADLTDGVSALEPPPRDREILAYHGEPNLGGGVALRFRSYKLMRNDARRPWTLFDLAKDPRELRSLSVLTEPGKFGKQRIKALLERQAKLASVLHTGDPERQVISEEMKRQLEGLGYLGNSDEE